MLGTLVTCRISAINTTALTIIYQALSYPPLSCFQVHNYLHLPDLSLPLMLLNCFRSSGKKLLNPYPKMLNDPSGTKKSYHRLPL